jgi:hypothetical protein
VSKILKSIDAITSLDQREDGESIYHQKEALDPNLVLLREWQSNRLANTYSDLMSKRRYALAGEFFLNDIYAARDFSQRDNDLEYLYDVMSSVLPKFMLTLVEHTIELNNLSNLLDAKLLSALRDELDLRDEITPAMYSDGYRICDNYDERKLQIELILEVGKQVDMTTKIPLLGTALKMATGPAHRTGWGDVHNFLARGFRAFKQMRGAKIFLDTVEKREMHILDQIFMGNKNPF